MKYAKIIVKNNYEEKGDLVLRELIRAFRKMHLDSLVRGDSIIIPGIVSNKENVFYLPFTGNTIEYHFYEEMNEDEFKEILRSLTYKEQNALNIILRKYIFKENVVLEDVSNMDELYNDRLMEQKAYDKGLSTINPYQKGHLNDYNDFLYKISESEKTLKKVV